MTCTNVVKLKNYYYCNQVELTFNVHKKGKKIFSKMKKNFWYSLNSIIV